MSPAAPHRRALILAGWLLWWLGTSPALAAPEFVLSAGFSHASLLSHIDLLEDPAGELGPADVTAPPWHQAFRPAAPGLLGDLPRHQAVWLRFALRNTTDTPRLLILGVLPSDLNGVALYEGDSGRRAVLSHPHGKGMATPIYLEPGQRSLYYLRLVPVSPLPVQLDLHSLDHFQADQLAQRRLESMGAAALYTLVVIALVLAALQRDPIFLWLAGYAAASATVQFDVSAAAPHYTPLDLNLVGLLLATTCVLQLTLRFPAHPRGMRPWRLALNALSAGSLGTAVALLASPGVGLYWLCNYMLLASVLATILCSLHGFLLEHRRLLLGFSLTRLAMLLAGTGIAATQGDFSPEQRVLGLLLLTMNLEVMALLALLLLRGAARQRQQSRRQQAIAAAEAEGRARTEIIAEVGHRLRTPVSGALGMLEMLQDTALSATQRDYILTIQRAGNELLNVVNDLSDVANLQASPGELQQTTFDLQVLVAECIDGFRDLAGASRLELISDPEPDLPGYVSGDPTRLRQILLQLLHYAIARCEQGELVIRVRALPQHWLRFTLVADARPAAGSTERRRPRPEHGLRLGVARQLVELLRGRIQVREGEPGRFEAAFDLILPQARTADAPTEGRESALRNKQLLVVDDNDTFCEVLRRQAGHWGMAVHTASSASEGLARLRNQANLGRPIDALLLDADMPELADGEWLLRLGAEVSPLPVVILLGTRPGLADSTALGELGVRRALFKPVNHTSLRITLAEELGYPGQPPRSAGAGAAPIRCLVAEDNAISTRVLVGLLQKLGVECTAVGNGQEAVEAYQRGRFDIVLMDCDMPIMDGWEATARIREIQAIRNDPAPPIIALTANTLAELGERARQPLMDAHLVKPINLADLRALLERWTGRAVHLQRPPAPE